MPAEPPGTAHPTFRAWREWQQADQHVQLRHKVLEPPVAVVAADRLQRFVWHRR